MSSSLGLLCSCVNRATFAYLSAGRDRLVNSTSVVSCFGGTAGAFVDAVNGVSVIASLNFSQCQAAKGAAIALDADLPILSGEFLSIYNCTGDTIYDSEDVAGQLTSVNWYWNYGTSSLLWQNKRSLTLVKLTMSTIYSFRMKVHSVEPAKPV
jgi:hypothetical protein